MGMFDSIYLDIKCPVCQEEHRIEFQTKEFDCQLLKWAKGEKLPALVQEEENEGSSLDTGIRKCWGSCKRAGQERFFTATVVLKDGVITGEVADVQLDPQW